MSYFGQISCSGHAGHDGTCLSRPGQAMSNTSMSPRLIRFLSLSKGLADPKPALGRGGGTAMPGCVGRPQCGAPPSGSLHAKWGTCQL